MVVLVLLHPCNARRTLSKIHLPHASLPLMTRTMPTFRMMHHLFIRSKNLQGKSTQCPQYILEDAISDGRGAATRIVVTQPRRIAAISVAERIADERDEDPGNSVGYAVRFNRRAPREAGASVEFVTTGVLLRRLVNDPSLDGVSHVMIDEVSF